MASELLSWLAAPDIEEHFFRYDGDAVEHVWPRRWDNRNEQGILNYVDHIGDTTTLYEFVIGVSEELLLARKRKDNHGIYATTNADLSEDDLRSILEDTINTTVSEDPLYPHRISETKRLVLVTGAGAAAVYAGVKLNDPLSGIDLIKPLTGAAGLSLIESAYNVSRRPETPSEAILANTYIDEINTIPHGEHTYCIQYRPGGQVRDDYHEPLTADGSE